jgi:hypothetical protein
LRRITRDAGLLRKGHDTVGGAILEAGAVASDGDPQRRRERLASLSGTPCAADNTDVGVVSEYRTRREDRVGKERKHFATCLVWTEKHIFGELNAYL